VEQPDSPFLQQARLFAEQLADAARPIAMAHFRQALAVEHKADHSPVTVADRAIETRLRGLIGAAFPGHGILGEEFGHVPGARYTWVLDPIDGTKSFITGLPLFGTLVCLLDGARPILGLIDIPATSERWLGLAGTATVFNTVECRASQCQAIESACIYTTSPDAFTAQEWSRYDTLSRRAALRRYGGDCYSYGQLASGHCDLVVEAGLQPYDFMALVPVVEGAGGRISDWRGEPLGLQSSGQVLAAANEPLWRQALAALA